MKIFFDHQTFSLQDYGGISRYYSELINAINNTQADEAHLSLLFTDNIHIRDVYDKFYSLYNGNSFPRKISIQYRLNKLFCKYEIKKNNFDIFHATYYDPYFVNLIRNKPSVVTFLDMIHERYSNKYLGLAADRRITKRKRELAEKSTAIIAISENTKNDIIQLFNVEPEKISVIPLGSSLQKVATFEPVYSLFSDRPPYLLFVGNRDYYKNFVWFIKAICPIIHKYKIHVICAGGGAFNSQERQLLSTLKIQDSVIQEPITDNKLAILYQNAIAFVFPSLYEGFGIPILEAFTCDCPCILSNCSSLPEVAGDAALYIDPEDSETLVNAVENLYSNNRLRMKLVERGRERLVSYSWKETAVKTLNLYHSL